jgi:hypothetical protein
MRKLIKAAVWSLSLCAALIVLYLSALYFSPRFRVYAQAQNFPTGGPCGFTGYVCIASTTGDIGAGINAALAAGVASGINIPTILIPPGNYTYSTTPWLNSPAKLECEPGSYLNYTGSSYALEVGPNGVTDSNYDDRPYEVQGCTFTGGASMVQGIFINYHAVEVKIHENWFHNFGNATAWDIWSQGANWLMRVYDNWAWADQRGANFPYNFMMTNGANAAGTAESDGGNSQLLFINNHIQNSSTHNSGIGLWLGGINAKVLINNITGFQPDLVFGYNTQDANVSDNYFEEFIQGATLTYPCIGYGTLSGAHTGAFTVDLILRHNYCNTHNSDFSTTGAFLAPMTASSGLQNSAVEGNTVFNLTSPGPLVVMNNTAGQADNEASNNRVSFGSSNLPTVVPNGDMHTVAGNVSNWLGSDGDLFYFNYAASRTDFNASGRFVNGSALFGYTDNGVTQTFKLDAFTGLLTNAATIASGTKPTVTGTGTCATSSTPLGGMGSGSIVCTGSSGAATITFTFSQTAPNFWNCNAYDATTLTDPLVHGTHTNATCVFSAAALVANDVIVFSANEY